jgi:nitroimidazol reductase NimA-like FMN-containing flavoprotein (pyridoxamine 5'-phosphate oxidase superfamily)
MHGVLACLGDGGYPYAVPLSYVYCNGKIYFHSAKAGHKIDAITNNPKVSFTVIDEDTVVSSEYTTYFRSVIAFGRARITEGDERMEAFKALADKYSGDQPEEARLNEINRCTQAHIIAVDVEHITGKESIEYVKAKNRKVEE